jgi:hypothetical protein
MQPWGFFVLYGSQPEWQGVIGICMFCSVKIATAKWATF